MARAPTSLVAYTSLVRRLARAHERKAPTRLTVLPPSVRDLAQRAEATPEFASLAADLFPTKHSPGHYASEVLKRTGFYNAALDSRFKAPRWNLISRRTVPHLAKVRTMLLLDLCAFPKERFRLLSYEVRRHSKSEIERLGPTGQVAEAFYRRERLDSDWYSQQWFLEKTQTERTEPGELTIYFGGDIVLDNHWQPLLVLSLYAPTCFQIPVVLDAQENWELAVRKFSQPQVDVIGEDEAEVPVRQYDVGQVEWRIFLQFVRRVEAGLSICHGWSRIKIAARRYLRATFLSTYDGDAWAGDETDDVLLQYVFSLEALLNTGAEAIGEKIAIRVALVAGRTDAERVAIKGLTKGAYSARSRLAHGRRHGREVDLPKLREICRRTIALSICTAVQCRSEAEFTALMEEALVSHTVQIVLQRRAASVQRLMKDTMPLSIA
jgi:Apea-like HEPN